MKRFLLLLLSILLYTSCTTTKSSSDITKFQRFYHNLTGEFNGYFNANEILDLSIHEMEMSTQDNYTQLLPIYPYTSNYDANSYKQNLDKAIVKVTTVATIHEKGQWVDDSYVLMGKAQYLKKDYESAEETLEYFREEFDNSRYHIGRKKSNNKLSRAEREKERKAQAKIKAAAKKERDKDRKEETQIRDEDRKEREKSRKQEIKARAKAKKKGNSRERAAEGVKWDDPALEDKKEKVEKTREEKKEEEEKKETEEKEKKEAKETKKQNRKHTPAYYEGLLWLAKTYSERERYASAEYIFNSLLEEEDAPKAVKKQIPLSQARMYLVKKDYDKAIASLDEAISVEKKKGLKARYSYIQAQIYTQKGEPGMALKSFEQVKKYRPDFEMQFNSDLNKIILRNETGSTNTKASLRALDKMLKEDKYDSYQGQIYYAIGEINYKSGLVPEAISDFQKSIYFNNGNTPQKAESYYRLGKLFFDIEDFAQAKYYYDSTLIHMPKTDYRHDETSLYASSLTKIASNIEIIKTQDSLLTIANLSKKGQRDYAKKVLDEQGAADNPDRPSPNPSLSTGTVLKLNASSFFAYNPQSLSRGKKTFRQEWGDRQLQDDWRSKSDSDDSNLDVDDTSQNTYSDIQIDNVLRSIPNNQAQKDLAGKKIQEAMFELGKLYREKLKNPEAGFAMHKNLIDDYPGFYKEPELLYYLYLSGKDIGKNEFANSYKNKLVKNYGETEFAKIVSDPNYAQLLIEKEKAPRKYYDDTYALFEKRKYKQVIARADKAVKVLKDDKELQPKMALLKAMSIGKEQGKNKYLAELNGVIKKYPNTPEERRATEMKRFLSGDETAFNELIFEEDSDIFTLDYDKLHYGLIIIYKASSKVVKEMQNDIKKFHQKYFSLDQLSTQISALSTDDNIRLILVRTFDDKSKAMDYYNVIDKKDKEFIKKKGYSFDFFVINQNNYREVVKARSINEYRIFFEDNYLKN